MPSRNSPFRFLLTLLLAFAVPFCCCDLRALLGGCASCGVKAPGATQEVAAHSDAAMGHHVGTHSHCHGHAPKGDDHDGSTSKKAPGNDQHDCSCDKTTGKMLTVGKSPLALPAPVVVAILDWSRMSDLREIGSFWSREIELPGGNRPPTALLRMHCALMV